MFLSPWEPPGKNTGVGSHSLLQGLSPNQGSNPAFLHCRQILYHLSHQGSIKYIINIPNSANIVDLLTLNSWLTALWLILEWSLSDTCIFSIIRHLTAWLCLNSICTLHLKPFSNSKVTNNRHKNEQNVTLNIPQKGVLFTVRELKK